MLKLKSKKKQNHKSQNLLTRYQILILRMFRHSLTSKSVSKEKNLMQKAESSLNFSMYMCRKQLKISEPYALGKKVNTCTISRKASFIELYLT